MSRHQFSREHEVFLENMFTRWTTGLTPIEQRISIFSHIRNIPYAIIPGWQNADDTVRMMVMENRGWCGPKHHLLIWMYRKLGIDIRVYFIPFRWQDQPVKYPVIMREFLPYLPDCTHLCCKAYLNGSWQFIDATWDPPLRSAGFPVNDPWDGISETNPAVIAINPEKKDLTHHKPSDRRKERMEFVTGLNRWMEEIRGQKVITQNGEGHTGKYPDFRK